MTLSDLHPGDGGGSSLSLLVMRGLTKRFTATLALDRVDFDVRRSEVHALRPERRRQLDADQIVAGVYSADSGDIEFGGRNVQLGTDDLPIALIHQDLRPR